MRPTLSAAVLAACSIFALALAAAQAPALKPDASPEEIMKAFESMWAELKDYSCTLDTKVQRGAKASHDILQYSFKKPMLWRSKVLEGADKGSSVARGPEGKIRANAGGVLGLVTVTMGEEDDRLKDPRGASLVHAHWGGQLALFRHWADLGWRYERLADEEIQGEPCYVLRAQGKPDAAGSYCMIMWFEKKTLAIRASKIWDGEILADDTVYRDVKIDQGLGDDAFRM